MPLPLVLIGVSVVTAAIGVWQGVDGTMDNVKAKEVAGEATKTYKDAEQSLHNARQRTQAALDRLGQLKLKVWDKDLTRFRRLYSQLHPIEMINRVDAEVGRVPVTRVDLGKMEELSGYATQALTSGALALGAGGLAGVAAYGGAMTFAAASTGTAISALSGAAATNATLAWFGGGSLAAGGLGMAGGTVVLGGLVAGPVLAVGGLVISAMARKNLASAKANLAQAKKAAAEMRAATGIVDGIRKVSSQFREMIEKARTRLVVVLRTLEWQIETYGTDYRQYDRAQRELVHVAATLAQVTKGLLETPFLTQEGALHPHYDHVLENAGRMLELQGST